MSCCYRSGGRPSDAPLRRVHSDAGANGATAVAGVPDDVG